MALERLLTVVVQVWRKRYFKSKHAYIVSAITISIFFIIVIPLLTVQTNPQLEIINAAIAFMVTPLYQPYIDVSSIQFLCSL
jgi:hypothetical protein